MPKRRREPEPQSHSPIQLSSDSSPDPDYDPDDSNDSHDPAPLAKKWQPTKPSPFDSLSDEVLLSIISSCDFWSRENLRTTCTRFKSIIDGEVKELVINRDWVTNLFKPKRFAYLRTSSRKNKNYLAPELRQVVREKLITKFIVRHPLLKSLSLHCCGMTLIHNHKGSREEFTEKLATNCRYIEQFLVSGSTGVTILISYLDHLRRLEDCRIRMKVLRVNPFQAGAILGEYLIRVLHRCYDRESEQGLHKLVIFATEFMGETVTRLIKNDKDNRKMLLLFATCVQLKLKSLVTCFRTDHGFKTAAIQHLRDMEELVLSGPIGTANEVTEEDFGMSKVNMQQLCDNNPDLKSLKVYLQRDACAEMSGKLSKLEKLMLVLPEHSKGVIDQVMSTSRPNLSVLGLTFLTKARMMEGFSLNFANSPHMEVLAVNLMEQRNVTAGDVLNLVSCLRNLREVYYTNKNSGEALDDPDLLDNLRRIFYSCRFLSKIFINARMYVRGQDRMVLGKVLTRDQRAVLEEKLFY